LGKGESARLVDRLGFSTARNELKKEEGEEVVYSKMDFYRESRQQPAYSDRW
jgi:hypothetical protein